MNAAANDGGIWDPFRPFSDWNNKPWETMGNNFESGWYKASTQDQR
jgi:hypothetical protein